MRFGKVLVTGAAGLIGTEVRHLLEEARWSVAGLDLTPSDQRGEPIEFVGDVCEGELVASALTRVEGVIHLAAIARVDEAEQRQTECTRVNLEGTRGLLHLARRQHRPPWIIFGSSREVYGEPVSVPVEETHALKPVNHYGRTKLLGERLVTAYGEGTGAPVSVLRFANVFGSLRDHATRVVPAFIRGTLAGDPLTVNGGSRVFDFAHVSDAAGAVVLAAERLANHGESLPALHISTGRGTSLQRLVEVIAGVAGVQPTLRHRPARAYEVTRFVGDPGRLERLLGMRCDTGLAEGIAEMVAGYRELHSPLEVAA